MNCLKVNHSKLVEFTFFKNKNIRKTDWRQRWIKNSFLFYFFIAHIEDTWW